MYESFTLMFAFGTFILMFLGFIVTLILCH
ncbi:putative holin-like toxin [Paenibacillus taiwanensis]